MNRLKVKFLNYMLQKLFPVFKMEKVMTSSKSGHLFLNGEVVREKQLAALKGEARMIRTTQVWEILTASMKLQAQKIAFNDSTTLQDLMNAKMILYTIDVMENTIKKIEDTR